MTEKNEQTDNAFAVWSFASVLPSDNEQQDRFFRDYSVYFEPTIEADLPNLENTECSIPDFSLYFEPVAPNEQTRRMFR